MPEDITWKSSLLLKGESFDDVPYEELCRRADGLPPRKDYKCIPKTKPFYEKYHFFCNILILCVVLILLDVFLI